MPAHVRSALSLEAVSPRLHWRILSLCDRHILSSIGTSSQVSCSPGHPPGLDVPILDGMCRSLSKWIAICLSSDEGQVRISNGIEQHRMYAAVQKSPSFITYWQTRSHMHTTQHFCGLSCTAGTGECTPGLQLSCRMTRMSVMETAKMASPWPAARSPPPQQPL